MHLCRWCASDVRIIRCTTPTPSPFSFLWAVLFSWCPSTGSYHQLLCPEVAFGCPDGDDLSWNNLSHRVLVQEHSPSRHKHFLKEEKWRNVSLTSSWGLLGRQLQLCQQTESHQIPQIHSGCPMAESAAWKISSLPAMNTDNTMKPPIKDIICSGVGAC